MEFFLSPQVEILAMNDNAFDDQYEGCTEEMENHITGILIREKAANQDFGRTCDEAEKKWNSEKPSVPSGFRDEYGIAIMAYTNISSSLYSNFNSAVRNYSGRDTFPYHSLHFLMTRGVVLLRPSCWWSTWSVYRGMSNTHLKPEAIGAEVRFGQFYSSSTSKKVSEGFGNDTFFTFTSCFGVKIKTYSYVPNHEEVLIPVDEVFQVTDFTEVDGKGRFVLKTTKRRCHFYNCDYIRPGGKSSTCVPSRGTREISPSAVVAFLLCQIIIFS
ncbi:PREDICTED: ecto-ADP-ribosyltransferase 5-like [Nanorana parkeri]|uniref:ecto-ADP-ribosyltransferase 5-like n=1 Tax=Nanorana parkeri TaxID=125878 RepID=UPI0008545E88|nr:PREDICTED: ecto-ADP-ribosyltransferase 5-like [Nanorana parkeri]